MEHKSLPFTASLNDRLILEAYTDDRSLKSDVKSGFAMISQKVTLKGLKVLMNAKLNDGTIIEKNSTAFVQEELLVTQGWAKKTFKCDGLEEQFIIVDMRFVEFVKNP